MTSSITPSRSVRAKLGPGHSFGEIFLYDTPRMYTVKSETDGVIYSIDRTTFRRTLELYEKNKLKERTKFLKDLSLFSPLTSTEIARLAEACIQLYFENDEIIIKRGENVDDHSYFYVIEKGSVRIDISITGVGQAIETDKKEFKTLGVGAHFGERALLTNEPRAADVIAQGQVTLIALERESFIHLLGPIEPLLNRSIESYGTIVLKEIPIFSYLSQQERDELYKLMERKNYNAGEYIYMKDMKMTHFNIILSGEVVKQFKQKDYDNYRYRLLKLASSEAIIVDNTNVLDGANDDNNPDDPLAGCNLDGDNNDNDECLSPDFTPSAKHRNIDNNDNKENKMIGNPRSGSSGLNNSKKGGGSTKGSDLNHSPSKSSAFSPSSALRKRQRLYSEGFAEQCIPTRSRSQSDWTGKPMDKEVYETLSQGDYFGGTSIIENHGDCICSYIAKDKVSLLLLPSDKFINLINEKPNLKRQIGIIHVSQKKGLERSESMFHTSLSCLEDNYLHSVSDMEFVKFLGNGAFGIVVLARNKNNHKEYALKCVRRSMVLDEKGRENKDTVAAVKQEKLILAELPPSVFIERFYGTAVDENNLYFILENIQGGELHTQMYNEYGSGLPMDEEMAKFYLSNIVLMLSELHKEKIVYRDLKPENLVIDNQTGYLKLIDFGFSKQVYRKTWTLCGTPIYTAPEILSCVGHSLSVDWWSLGIMSYEMRVGDTPFCGADPLQTFTLILNCDIDFSRAVFSPNLKDLITKLLMRSQIKRLGSGTNGYLDIQNHPWFNSIDWEKMSDQEYQSPKLRRQVKYKNKQVSSSMQTLGFGNPDWIKETSLANF